MVSELLTAMGPIEIHMYLKFTGFHSLTAIQLKIVFLQIHINLGLQG